ncbi:MAG: hypothetical protein ACTSRN_03925, partial [Alphaproteobacteria bacterium]
DKRQAVATVVISQTLDLENPSQYPHPNAQSSPFADHVKMQRPYPLQATRVLAENGREARLGGKILQNCR